MIKYSYSTGNRWLLLLMFALFVVFAVFVVVRALAESDAPGLLFLVVWLAALGWNAYWFLWRFSYRVEVRDDLLRWMTPLRNGEVAVADVEKVRLGWLGQTTVFQIRDREDVTVVTRKGIVEFAREVTGDTLAVPFYVRFGEVRTLFRRGE